MINAAVQTENIFIFFLTIDNILNCYIIVMFARAKTDDNIVLMVTCKYSEIKITFWRFSIFSAR